MDFELSFMKIFFLNSPIIYLKIKLSRKMGLIYALTPYITNTWQWHKKHYSTAIENIYNSQF